MGIPSNEKLLRSLRWKIDVHDTWFSWSRVEGKEDGVPFKGKTGFYNASPVLHTYDGSDGTRSQYCKRTTVLMRKTSGLLRSRKVKTSSPRDLSGTKGFRLLDLLRNGSAVLHTPLGLQREGQVGTYTHRHRKPPTPVGGRSNECRQVTGPWVLENNSLSSRDGKKGRDIGDGSRLPWVVKEGVTNVTVESIKHGSRRDRNLYTMSNWTSNGKILGLDWSLETVVKRHRDNEGWNTVSVETSVYGGERKVWRGTNSRLSRKTQTRLYK